MRIRRYLGLPVFEFMFLALVAIAFLLSVILPIAMARDWQLAERVRADLPMA